MLSASPRFAAYVAALPEGLDSHPTFFAKAALLRSLISNAVRERADALPACLRELVLEPPPASSWVPQVHAHAVVVFARDIAFASDDQFAAFCYDQQRQLFASRLYRLLMRCTSPARVLATVQRRWSAFNRGTSVTAIVDGARGSLCIDHPVGLFDASTRTAVVEALRATLDLSSARAPMVAFGPCTPTRTELLAQW